MSLYEILAVAALAAAGGYAWSLYRADTRSGVAKRPAEGETQQLMFGRNRRSDTDSKR
jgi:hypothetical protein